MTIVIPVARGLEERPGRYLEQESMRRVCIGLKNVHYRLSRICRNRLAINRTSGSPARICREQALMSVPS